MLRLLSDLSMRNLILEKSEQSLNYNRGQKLKLSAKLSYL